MAEKTEKEKKISKPSWVKMKPAELEKIVVELAKEGKSPAQIGLVLRDKHGIPKAKLLGKKISEILKEKGVHYKTEEVFVKKKIDTLKKHFEKNRKDYCSSKSLSKKLWVLHSFEK